MIYEQNSQATFYATFLNFLGEPAKIAGIPKITIRFKADGVFKTLVDHESMFLIESSSYYFPYFISAGAKKTDYRVLYEASYTDHSFVTGAETFKVVAKDFFEKKRHILGTVQIWTKEEKEKVIEAIDLLLKNIVTQVSRNDLLKLIDELGEIIRKFDFGEIFQDFKNNQKRDMNILMKDLSELREKILSSEERSLKIQEIEPKIKKLAESFENIKEEILKTKEENLLRDEILLNNLSAEQIVKLTDE